MLEGVVEERHHQLLECSSSSEVVEVEVEQQLKQIVVVDIAEVVVDIVAEAVVGTVVEEVVGIVEVEVVEIEVRE